MANFFLYKQLTYQNLLKNLPLAEAIATQDKIDFSRDDYANVLKSSIRTTYFHCIETLFELVFAIEAGITIEANERQDELILERLATSNFRANFSRIEKLAARDSEELEKLNRSVRLKSTNLPFLQYAFYYIASQENLPLSDNTWSSAASSLFPIQEALVQLAQDFANRGEYNAYKHGLRILPIKHTFQAHTTEGAELLRFDFSDAMTFLHRSKTSVSLTAKSFDTERDFKMTVLASDLISNIIGMRKAFYFSKPGDQVHVRFYDDKRVADANRSNIKARRITFTWQLTNPSNGQKPS